MADPEILVRGAGVVGLAAALALSRQGFAVALRDPRDGAAAAPDIRAYALNAASVALLSTLKVWDAIAADARTPVHDMRIEGDDAVSALDLSAWSQGWAELAWIVDGAELERALRAAAAFAPHLTWLAPGAADPVAALEVVAEGGLSARRAQLGVVVERRAYGQHAIAARLLAAQPHGGLARQWFRSPDVLALLPLDRPRPGHGLALVWSLPQPRADELMAADDTVFGAALHDATGAQAGALELVGPRAAWPLALALARPLHGPGWVLVGDAAHQVHPLAGQGMNLGLADVASLADALAQSRRDEPWRTPGDPRVLARHARRRAFDTGAMAAVTDALLHLFAHSQPLVRGLRNQGLAAVNRLAPLKSLLLRRAGGG